MKSTATDKPSMPLDIREIKRRREEMGLSMEQAGKLAGIGGRQNWYRIESGNRTDVALSTLEKLARALQCRPQDLLK